MPQVLFHLGARPIYTYTLLVDAGLLARFRVPCG